MKHHFASLLLCLSTAISSPLAQMFRDDTSHETSLLERSAAATKIRCAKGLHIAAVSGAGPNTGHDYGRLSTTVDAIRALIPGTTNYSIPYNRTNDDSQFENSVAGGVTLLTAYLEKYILSCPNTPIAVIGSSAGGVITMDTFCGFSRQTTTRSTAPISSGLIRTIIAVVTHGEESHVPYQPWNNGSCVTGHGMVPRGNPRTCDPYASVLQDYSLLNDPFSCIPSPNPNPANHALYGQTYDPQVSQWIQQKYLAFNASAAPA